MENNPGFEPGGVLLLDKAAGWTSFDVVAQIRKLFGTKKVGHAGTLDPMATGVLPVLIGRATKLEPFLVEHRKKYRATLRLGLTTDTGDITGTVLRQCDALPSADEVIRVSRTFSGTILQTPPMYSALKVNGQKLVDLARAGKTVERKPRPVEIYDLEIRPTERKEAFELTVSCGKGTYIRTLCEDIGSRLGCGGTMEALRRLEVTPFSIEECVTLDRLKEMSPSDRSARLLSPQKCLPHLPLVEVNDFQAALAQNGVSLRQEKIGVSLHEGQQVLVTDTHKNLICISKAAQDESGQPLLKPLCIWKVK